ncbi:MAG: hypothetical protein RLZZ458_2609 [Planctomycetota bacterium]
MAEHILKYLMLAACVGLLLQTIRYRRLIIAWTVSAGAIWQSVAACVVGISVASSLPMFEPGPGWSGTLQYLVAILLLTPSICTLGARKPRVATWQAFVVVPMILVLLWPVFTQAVSTSGRTPVELSNPQLCGFLLAALMGIGPTFGTAATPAALLRLTAVTLALIPLRSNAPWAGTAADFVPLVLLLEITLQHGIIVAIIRRIHESETLHDGTREIWFLFQTLYGTVWPRRIMERMSQFERAEKWTVTLREYGFESLPHYGDPEIAPKDSDLQQPIGTLRWLLGRFVSAEWLGIYFP